MSDHPGYKKPPSQGGSFDFSDKWRQQDEVTSLELVDKLIATTPEGDPVRFDLFRLRQQIQEHDLTLTEARARARDLLARAAGLGQAVRIALPGF